MSQPDQTREFLTARQLWERRRLASLRELDLEPLLDNSEAMAEPFSTQLPSTPLGWDHYHRQLNEELTRNDQQDFSSNVKTEPADFTKELRIKDDEQQLQELLWRDLHPKPEEMSQTNVDTKAGEPKTGYMSKASPFSLDTMPPDMSFLEWYPQGNATLSYTNDLGDVETISGLSPWIIEERSFLLAQAFEESRTGPQLHLETLSSLTARPFLQFLYTGGYALPTPTGEPLENVPTSLLIHCQLYRLADIYDLAELRSCANLNIIRQCEFGCSSPDKPIDLCAAIDYVYKNMREQAGVIDTIVNYCVTCFLSHALADDFDFRRLAFDLRPFHQDLAKESMSRGFDQDDIAQAIIQMPFKPYVPETYASREDFFRRDVVFHFHGDDGDDHSSLKKRKCSDAAPVTTSELSQAMLAIRTKRDAMHRARGLPEEVEVTSEGSNKRRLSRSEESFWTAASATCSDRPVEDNSDDDFPKSRGQLRVVNADPVKDDPEEPMSSDSDFCVVPGPAPVEELSSESDSESDTLVKVERSNSMDGLLLTLPIRNRTATSSAEPSSSSAGNSSDSEWDLV